ncbi:uncharacterized protein [Epargyreus clarus]|uniref:uncharacterized protein isoform X1 n=1 Tax=Epargyreus clarus TaxID=520877 RepID=UPI003C2B5A98
MFINVTYKDAPELSNFRRSSSEPDLSVEKMLLVNPNCPVRIMLEYIRKKCKLGIFSQFDLCDEAGGLMGLFNLPTYAYATEQFEHKKTYYIIILKELISSASCLTKEYFNPAASLQTKQNEMKILTLIIESDRRLSVLPQLNHDNDLYLNLKNRVKRFIATGDTSPITPPPGKATPPTAKPAPKKK